MILKVYRTVAQRFKAFESKKEMDEHVKAHIFASGRKLHKNARAVLDLIVRHSCSVYGVSWLSEETIAEEIEVHLDTVKRAFKRLIELGIGRFEVVEVSSISLRYFVINRYSLADELQALCEESSDSLRENLLEVESVENPTETSVQTSSQDDEPLRNSETQETQDQEINKDVKDDTLDASFTPSHIPEAFVKVVRPFFNDAQKIYRLWGVVQTATKKLDVIEAPLESVVQSFKETVFAFKNGKIRKTFESYMYGTILNKITLFRRQKSEQESYLSALLEEDDQNDSLRCQLDFIDAFYGASV